MTLRIISDIVNLNISLTKVCVVDLRFFSSIECQFKQEQCTTPNSEIIQSQCVQCVQCVLRASLLDNYIISIFFKFASNCIQ